MHLLAALSWDPQIRGALIVITAFLILPGSVYLLLATNTGAKVGFLIAAAGFFGWMAVMAWIWVVYGIGLRGDSPTWHVEEVVTGNLAENGTTDEALTFPTGWRKLAPGDAALAEATASADQILAPSADAGGHAAEGATPTEVPPDPVFDDVTEYVQVGGYMTGGENYWIPGGGLASEANVGNRGRNPLEKLWERVKRGPFHEPRYAVVQVAPVLDQGDPEGDAPPPKPVPDPDEPITNVVMVRDPGDLRLPSVLIAISMSIVFGLIANALHRRDREVMAARRPTPATVG